MPKVPDFNLSELVRVTHGDSLLDDTRAICLALNLPDVSADVYAMAGELAISLNRGWMRPRPSASDRKALAVLLTITAIQRGASPPPGKTRSTHGLVDPVDPSDVVLVLPPGSVERLRSLESDEWESAGPTVELYRALWQGPATSIGGSLAGWRCGRALADGDQVDLVVLHLDVPIVDLTPNANLSARLDALALAWSRARRQPDSIEYLPLVPGDDPDLLLLNAKGQ